MILTTFASPVETLVHNPSPTLERRGLSVERVWLDEPGLGDQSGGSTKSVTKLPRLYPEDLIESA